MFRFSVTLKFITEHFVRSLCPGGHPDCSKVSGCPRLLHYSASLHLVDMLPPPPPIPTEDPTDTQSFTSDEG